MEEKIRMRMTPKTMTAVPLMSVEVTAEVRSMQQVLTCANEPVCEDEVENERRGSERSHPVCP